VRAASGPVLAVAASGEGAQRSERVASSLMHRHAARVAPSSRLFSRRALHPDDYRCEDLRGLYVFVFRKSSIETLNAVICKSFFVIWEILGIRISSSASRRYTYSLKRFSACRSFFSR